MKEVFFTLLCLHIAGGGLGLLVGTLILFLRKGDRNHRKLGLLFYWGMCLAGATSLVMAVLHPNYFLFIVGIFTLYMNLSAKRYLRFKKNEQEAQVIDYVISAFMLVFGVVFIAFGIYLLVQAKNFGIVFLVFGSIGLRFVRQDYLFKKSGYSIKLAWLSQHIQRMMGTYIASLTAFLVVNSSIFPQFIPSFVFWLLPGIIVGPLIGRFVKKYTQKVKHS
ncbi:hypothetical protein G9H64_12215 [Aquirufa nivalisilvae]|uniref:DUF2306 domain-containing protein n=1 Tax=Aquirufa nivalisilvae TaxID=2516557 RepID=A0A2S2DWF8_9BACT|nr:hypothetical protein [Aquirufa nivalisilvae]AWL09622.1 hypothetical protein HME7025_01770 [Aquirufa nivalisilvae]MCZ2480967.1 hypothetical protein [Aquirufa nivalisilvae]MCZ2483724.1 hypothetical protein [Aquirufa nivalisilvae]